MHSRHLTAGACGRTCAALPDSSPSLFTIIYYLLLLFPICRRHRKKCDEEAWMLTPRTDTANDHFSSSSREDVEQAVSLCSFFFPLPVATLDLEQGQTHWLQSTQRELIGFDLLFLGKHFLGSGVVSGTCPSVCAILAFKILVN